MGKWDYYNYSIYLIDISSGKSYSPSPSNLHSPSYINGVTPSGRDNAHKTPWLAGPIIEGI